LPRVSKAKGFGQAPEEAEQASPDGDIQHGDGFVSHQKPWFQDAPHILIVAGRTGEAWTRQDGWSSIETDLAIAMDHLVLAATELGLGTCWIAKFDPVAARDVLHLPCWLEPVVFATLGYSDSLPPRRLRRPLAELVRYERWPEEPIQGT
jgi:nitroreductase